ncbi:MAG: DUF4266 domain-containing protein [Gammaproteobacteria bacterium]|nr:DUF4266 domain-containing protein [Gammaproteobacteria bacterium]
MKKIAALSLILVIGLSGCSVLKKTASGAKGAAVGAGKTVGQIFKPESVKPWQRSILSEDSMQLTPDAMDAYVDEHVYFSKEGSRGGSSIGGGGCGCN